MNIIKKIFPEKLKARFRKFRSYYGALRNGFPAKKLKFIGVTGTSGKSTTTNMIYHILNESGFNAGVISTNGARAGKKEMDTGLHVTTPDPIQFQNILKFMVRREVEWVVVETSSHALAQERLGNVKFEHAVFTNIKRDHLDWHGTWENYALAKAKLIDKTRAGGHIVINREDKDMYNFLRKYIDNTPKEENIITYSINEPTEIHETAIGTRFKLNDTEYLLSVLGLYNVENALASINICKLLGLSDSQIAKAISSFIGLEGRMQIMQSEPYIVIVDFAHNTDALVKSLETAQNLKAYNGRVISIFGSAGERDVEKRYTMGEAAAKHSDIVIITAEDPRSEKLEKINTQIIKGAEMGGGKLIKRFANTEEFENYKIDGKEIDRKSVFSFDEESVNSRFDAIQFAINIAKEGDVIITEGKGHEKSLAFGKTEYDFTDQEAVRRALGE